MNTEDDADENIVELVKETIGRHGMIEPGESVLAAVSGGADSVFLVRVLAMLSVEQGFSLAVAHLDHGLRGQESRRDADFVRELAETLELPCYSAKADVEQYAKKRGLSLEEAARELRYDFLQAAARKHGLDKIATGHQKDDLAETVLIHMLRGSGPTGLSGMMPARGNIVRPLIGVRRRDIERYLSRNAIAFVTDSSNADTKFVRNRVRHRLLPVLEREYNPAIVEALNRSAQIARDENDFLDSVAESVYKMVKKPSGRDRVALDIGGLKKAHVALVRRVARKAAEEIKGDLRRIEWKHVEAVVELIGSERRNGAVDFPGPIRIERQGERIFFLRRCSSARPAKKKARAEDLFEYEILRPQTIYVEETGAVIEFAEVPAPELDEAGRLKNVDADPRLAFFDRDVVSFPIVVRSFRPGDVFRPLGAGGRRKLKKFFIDNKIPAPERRRIPIVESGGKIVWVAGHRIDESAKVAKQTRTVLRARLLAPEPVP